MKKQISKLLALFLTCSIILGGGGYEQNLI